MKALSFVLGLSVAGLSAVAAVAADLPTKKAPPAPAAAAKINCFESVPTWFFASPTDCPLSYWGVTLYGTVDVGAGYATNGAHFDPQYPNGVNQLPSTANHHAGWQWMPNGLSQSNVGIKFKEPAFTDWYVIGDVNAGFDPYSLRFTNGPGSLADNNALGGFARSANGDSSRTYGPINTRAYAGIQNKTFGTLTYGRQYAFSNDNDNNYDPFGGAYAFSLVGTSGTLGGGLGDTELARYNNSIKYVYADHNIRAGIMSQVGGWAAYNNAQQAIQGDLGFDYAGFSVDGVYAYAKDAVSLGVFGSVPPAPLAADTLKATIQNINAGQIVAKYKWDQFTIYGGYQLDHITNPSDLPAGKLVRDFNGGYPAQYGVGIQTANNFPTAKNLQVAWIGGKWSVLPYIDLAAGYYHVWQNDYLGSTQTATSCIPNTTANPLGGTLKGTNSGKCAGTEDAISGMIDWKATKRFDVYLGTMYSKANGGLASGLFADSNWQTTAGARLNF